MCLMQKGYTTIYLRVTAHLGPLLTESQNIKHSKEKEILQ
jgi:hypothetical protein